MNCVLIGYPRSGTYVTWEILKYLLPDHEHWDLSGEQPDAAWPAMDQAPTLLRHHYVDQFNAMTASQIQNIVLVTTVRKNLWDMCVSKCLADVTGTWQSYGDQDPYQRRDTRWPDPVDLDYDEIHNHALYYYHWRRYFALTVTRQNIRTVAVDFDQLTESQDPASWIAGLLQLRPPAGPGQDFSKYQLNWRPRDIVKNYNELHQRFHQQWPKPWPLHTESLEFNDHRQGAPA